MPKSRRSSQSFNAGELSPRLEGRTDFDKYHAGCYKLRNFIPLVQGPAERRPGSHLVAAVKQVLDRTWLVPFSFNTQQSYVIEMGNSYARFYTQRAQLLSAPFTPYEIAAPYLVADLTNTDGTFRPSFVQSNDVMFWANGGYFPQMLERFAATNWRFRTFGLPGPTYMPRQIAFQYPFKSFANDPNVKIQASAATGAINLTALSGAPFASWMVGLYMLIQSDSGSHSPAWEPGKVIGRRRLAPLRQPRVHHRRRRHDRIVKPTHTEGIALRRRPGRALGLRDAGYGVVRIDGFIDAAHVTATVIMELPVEA
jgi:hypothetical protein